VVAAASAGCMTRGRHFPAPLRTAVVAAGGWLVRELLLLGAADLWITSDPVSRADVIAALGGGLETRPS
jgi:hypothetical protein